MKKSVYGVAFYESSEISSKDEFTVKCMKTWLRMLERCYSSAYIKRKPTYAGCNVCDEWLNFSNFKSWMQQQDWDGKELDKDILKPKNKTYSPENCCFVDRSVNSFFLSRDASRGDFKIGVSFRSDRGKFYAGCSNPFLKKRVHLGFFDCEDDAHQAWLLYKISMAEKLALLEKDEKIANAIRSYHKTVYQLKIGE